ncbi:MAG: phosphoribosylaminoimidazolesuccinocarboxamide synthase [Actinobacteria bacterium]|nr:phosphoribosylaminoimidazolesuccinocarboxamide synthase [Actinomycetota bacterium]
MRDLRSEIRPDFQGKVRDIYDVGDHLLMVASDRISVFDVVFPEAVPYKGQVLTGLSLYWFEVLGDVVGNHFISADVADLPSRFTPYADYLRGRFMLVKKASVFPVECIVRGYLAGSGWSEYVRTGAVCGIELQPGLEESARLEAPIFTPTTKAKIGQHDENISYDRMVDIIGNQNAEEIRRLSLALYAAAHEHAVGKGVIIADTKFEFGVVDGHIVLVDEALTPDSSRFWPADEYMPGRMQASFDKQYVRDWLDSAGWDRQSEPPPLPQEVILGTSERYIQAYELITGREFAKERDR